MTRYKALAILVAFAALMSAVSDAQSPPPNTSTVSREEASITVVTEGIAVVGSDVSVARDEAVWDAKRSAVEQAVGVSLHASSIGSHFAIEQDEIRSRCMGFVRAWNVVPDSTHVEMLAGERVLHVKVNSTVALAPMIHEISEMKALYDEMERPKIRVDISGGAGSWALQETLCSLLKSLGFDVSEDGICEIVMKGRLTTVPTLKLGEAGSPGDLALTVAACRSVLTLEVVSQPSEDLLMTARVEASGQSFQSDGEAEERASEMAGKTLVQQKKGEFVDQLIARWLHERQEGYEASIEIRGLSDHECDLLQQAVADMRGFRHVVEETRSPRSYKLRFVTRLDGKTLRARLSALTVNSQHVAIVSHHGPVISCSVYSGREITSSDNSRRAQDSGIGLLYERGVVK